MSNNLNMLNNVINLKDLPSGIHFANFLNMHHLESQSSTVMNKHNQNYLNHAALLSSHNLSQNININTSNLNSLSNNSTNNMNNINLGNMNSIYSE